MEIPIQERSPEDPTSTGNDDKSDKNVSSSWKMKEGKDPKRVLSSTGNADNDI